jgi:(2S)-methylsuccinyl-CoA dehydrogenase
MTRLAVASPGRDIGALAAAVADAADILLAEATAAVRARVLTDGKLSVERLEAEQAATHGLSWLATYVEAIRQLASYVARLSAESRFGKTE